MATPRFSSPAHSQLRLSRMRFHAAWMKIASKKHPCRLRYELRHRTSSNFFRVASHKLELHEKYNAGTVPDIINEGAAPGGRDHLDEVKVKESLTPTSFVNVSL